MVYTCKLPLYCKPLQFTLVNHRITLDREFTMVYSFPINWNVSGDKWSSVDGLVLQCIEWNVELTQVCTVDTIEIKRVVIDHWCL